MKPRYIVLTAAMALLGVAVFAGVWGSRRQPLGVKEGRLLPCPTSPNCVSSFDEGEHGMEAIPYTGTSSDAMNAIVQVLTGLPRTTLLAQTGNYARFTVRSARVGFTDDVEFLVTDARIHFRSASRLGYDDLGVNRERMTLLGERLRERL